LSLVTITFLKNRVAGVGIQTGLEPLRHQDARPLWEKLQAWLRLERSRVPEGGSTA
jgi:hypothetical protein